MENTTPTTADALINNANSAHSPETKQRIEKAILNLPGEDGWAAPLRLYQGFWFHLSCIEGDILAHQYFKAEPSDIFLCSFPKCGTTWLKALAFAIVTRTRYDNSTTPLLTKLPHDVVPFLFDFAHKPDIREPGLPLISTHVHYDFLPKSVLDSDCKVVYICREPKDAFVSLYHFVAKLHPGKIHLDKVFDLFCQGKSFYGPYWDHVLGFWKASRERPGKVLFLRYEDMMKDTAHYVKRLAEFMGYPFSLEEQEQGAVQKIIELCSFDNIKNFQVNKTGTWERNLILAEHKTFFRKGEVGDWKNWLTPEMAQRLDNIMEEKLNGSGFTFSSQC